MNNQAKLQSPKWLRVSVHILVAWSTFWALFWGCLALLGLIPATQDLVGTPVVIMLGVMTLIGATGSFFVTRMEIKKLHSCSSVVFATLGILLLIVGWILAPNPFTYVMF